MKKLILFCCVLVTQPALAKGYYLPHDMLFDISGYVGWRQVISDVEFDSIPSQPEIGITTSLKVTDRLQIYNQVKYGTSFDDVLVYSQVNYTPDIPIDDFSLTLKGGRMWLDWGLYNKTRINPRTRQGVFQPQAMYWNTFAQSVTSVDGVGATAKYKNFSVTYTTGKSRVIDPDKEAVAWTLIPNATDVRFRFGDLHTLHFEYNFPTKNVRLIADYNDVNTDVSVINNKVSIRGQRVAAGVEWTTEDFMLSIEGLCVKRDEWSWAPFSRLYCGISPTAEYNINDNFTIRANYNQYRTPFDFANQKQTYTKDMNIGIGWHTDNWIANIEAHYIQGGRLVDSNNFFRNPDQYDHFYIVGMNLVYFWE